MRNTRWIILLSLIAISNFGVIGQATAQTSKPVSIEDEGYMYLKEDDVLNAKDVLIAGINKEKIEELAKAAENTPEGVFILYLNAMMKYNYEQLRDRLYSKIFEGFEKGFEFMKLQESGKIKITEEQKKGAMFYVQSGIYDSFLNRREGSGKWFFDIVKVEYIDMNKKEAIIKIRYNLIGEGIDKGHDELLQFNYLLVKEGHIWKFAYSRYLISQMKKFIKDYPELVEKEKQRRIKQEEESNKRTEEDRKRRKENK